MICQKELNLSKEFLKLIIFITFPCIDSVDVQQVWNGCEIHRVLTNSHEKK